MPRSGCETARSPTSTTTRTGRPPSKPPDCWSSGRSAFGERRSSPESLSVTSRPARGLHAYFFARARRPGYRRLRARRLEQLDRIASGILEQDLLAARPTDDVVAKRQAGGTQPLDLRRDVFDDEVDAVPAPRLRGAAVGHRPPGRAHRAAEQQPQVAAHDVGERGRGAGAQLEAEVGGVEGHGVLDVVDHVADVHVLVRHVLSPPGGWWSGRLPR